MNKTENNMISDIRVSDYKASDNRFYFYKGRVALYALLKAFGVGPGDHVMLPGYTCIVVPSAVKYLGATPQYADIDPKSYNALLADYQKAYQRMEEQGTAQQLKAVIIQHTYGNPNKDTKAIVQWAQEKGLFILEDCAHVNGVIIDGQPAGTFGHGSFFSTQWSKPFTTGLGGIAQVNVESYKDAVKELEAAAPKPSGKESLILNMQLFVHTHVLRPSIYWFAINTHRTLSKMGLFVGSSTTGELEGEMPEDYFKGMGIQQRSLLPQRESGMAKVNAHRIWLADHYDKLLREKGITPYQREKGAVLIRYPILVKDRTKCLAAAEKAKIELGDWFNHPLHPEGSVLTGLNWQEANCPQAVQAAKHMINLPLHLKIDADEAKRIVNFITRQV